MSARSLLLEALLLVGACKHPPEADPAKVTARAVTVAKNAPAPGAVPTCKPDDLVGATMTQRTLLELAKWKIDDEPERADWINPAELDSAAARVLGDPAADAVAARRAAAELLAAPAWIVYRIDLVNAPMAIGVKDPKIGTVGGRVIRFDRNGTPTCVVLFTFQNTQDKSDWAIAHATRAIVEPEIARALRDDLTAQYLKLAPRARTSR